MADVKEEIKKHIPQLRRYARALINRTDLADDLVQDSLERAWSKRHLWNENEPIRPWLFSIMHNVFANNARKFRRSPEVVPFTGDEMSSAEDDIDTTLTDLQTAMNSLPSEQREIVLLVGLEQMSYKETAIILNIPQGTVMSRLARARKRLRALMTDPTVPTVSSIHRVK